ncbi:MAG: S-methyl-5-thioribose-1-phosphate isomerase, partial [Oscillospiraceae bacterium]
MTDALHSTHADNVRLEEDGESVVILDQTQLPNRTVYLALRTPEEMFRAIASLQVRGAPAIGICAGYCSYVLAQKMRDADYKSFAAAFHRQAEYLNSSRPTAVNLSWALGRMEGVVTEHPSLPVPQILDLLRAECCAIQREDIAKCRAIAEHGLTLLRAGDGVLTHCNAGSLAASRYGTALGPLFLGQEQGMHVRVFADETRPLLQGARLTAYELSRAGIDVTLICDNMASIVMK